MNYIVFDLEWNQSSKPGGENDLIPFEIIEIGAVKLNSKFNIIDEYGSIIRPQIYTRLQSRIREMLNYDESLLKTGRHFDIVCKEFLEWCGEDYIFCTWGPLDLYYLQQNMDFYMMPPLEKPLRFYNLQDIFEMYFPDLGACRLEKAVDHLDIISDQPFHSAINDARYTGLVMAAMKLRNLNDLYSVDYYNNPKSIDEEVISRHKTYSEHISREFDNKNDAMMDKNLLTLYCAKCNRKIAKKIKWFSNNSSSYLCVGKCWYHGYVLGKIKFKHTFDDKVFMIKKTQMISKSEMEHIKDRQILIREKRKEKNKKSKPNSDSIQ